MSDIIYIQEPETLVISVCADSGPTLSTSDGYPVPDWAAIQNKPDFDGLYYPLSNPSGFATGIDASSLVSRSETGAFYPAASNPSGYLTSGRITGVGGTLAYASGNYLVISGSSGGGLTQSQANSLYYPLATNPSGYIVGSVVRPNTYLLSDASSSASIDWNAKVLYADGLYSLDWSNGFGFDTNEDVSLDWKNKALYSFGSPSLDWSSRQLFDLTEMPSLDWSDHRLIGAWTISGTPTSEYDIVNLGFVTGYPFVRTSGTQNISGETTFLGIFSSVGDSYFADSLSLPSLYPHFRVALSSDSQISIDWENRILSGDWSVSTPSSGAGIVNKAYVDSNFYPVSNPSGFATGLDASLLVAKSETGAYTGQFYPRSTNPSGYVTGSVVRPSETGSFITVSQTGQFYPSSNPSGYATGVDVSNLVLKSETGAYTGIFYPRSANPDGYLTGLVVRPSETGDFITNSQTGDFYPRYNPSGYITSSSLSTYATQAYVDSASGVIRTDVTALQGATGSYYLSSNPSGYITGLNTGSFITSSQTGAFYASSNPSGFVTGDVIRPAQTGSFLTAVDIASYATTGYVNSASGAIRTDIASLQTATGLLYPITNPSGYVTSSETGLLTGSFYPLISNPSGYKTGDYYTKSEITTLLGFENPFYFVSGPSDTSGYSYMTNGSPSGGRATGVYTSVVDSQYLTGFITQSGFPGFSGTVIGNNIAGIHARKTSENQKATSLYYQLWKYDTSGNSSLLVESDPVETLSAIEVHAYYPYYLTGINLIASDRIIVKWLARVAGAGLAPTINLIFGGDSLSAQSLPYNSILSAQAFYPANSNPSGYLTAAQTGVLTGSFYPLLTNPASYVTGSVVRPAESGALTGVFYPLASNPSGYVTGSVTRPSETGSLTGSFYPLASNPSGYVELNRYSQVPSEYLPYSNFEETIDKLLWNKVTGDKPVFSTFDHATPSYIKNTSGLGADIDLTCCSVWNSDYGQEKGGTLITPRHLAMAYHFPIATGSTLRFVTNDNQVITRTLTGAVRLGGSDVMIAGLDSDLPDTITPAQILPSGYNSAIFAGGRSAGISINRLRNISVCKIEEVDETEGSFDAPIELNRSSFFTEVVAGDSGGPVFLLAGSQPIFLGSVHTTSNFDWVSKNPTALNSALSQLGGGHTASILDLMRYASYQLNGTSLDIQGSVDVSTIDGNTATALLQVINDNGVAISATSASGLALDVLSVAGTAIQANTFGNSSIAVFAKVYSNQLEITSNGSLYFPQQSTTVSSSGQLLTGSSATLDWVSKSLSEQWTHASIASSSGHVANYHAVTGYSYPRGSNPSGYLTAAQTGALTGAFYPLSANPSSYVTGSVVRPSDTGSFLTSSQTGVLTGVFYPRDTNPSGYVTGSVVRSTETGSFVTTGQTGNFYPRYENPSGYLMSSSVNSIGSVVISYQSFGTF